MTMSERQAVDDWVADHAGTTLEMGGYQFEIKHGDGGRVTLEREDGQRVTAEAEAVRREWVRQNTE